MAGSIAQLFRSAARKLLRDEDDEEPRQKEKEKTEGSFRMNAAALFTRMRRAVTTIAIKLASGAFTARSADHAPAAANREAYEEAGAFLENTLDSMNPYWEPDAHLTGIASDEYNTPPAMADYCPLQL
jgi:hypothetical protein